MLLGGSKPWPHCRGDVFFLSNWMDYYDLEKSVTAYCQRFIILTCYLIITLFLTVFLPTKIVLVITPYVIRESPFTVVIFNNTLNRKPLFEFL